MHGGDIYNNQVNIDYSVNINPLGVPEKVKKALTESLNSITSYPEYGAGSLRHAIAQMNDSPSANIVCGNGASELIMAVVNVVKPSRVLIPVPAFQGYKRAVKSLFPECEIKYVFLSETCDYRVDREVSKAIRDYKPELVFVTNPGNPTGRLIEPDILQDIVDACYEVGSYIVIDECFLQLTGRIYDIALRGKVITLKAFTKSYAIPGIRLGYCICSDVELAAGMEAVLPEWNISIPAIAAGKAALKESDYIKEAVRIIEQERHYLKEAFEELGIKTFASDANYLVFKVEGESEKSGTDSLLFEKLLKRGILIRDCNDYEGMGDGFYRVAVKEHKENVILISNIRECL